MEVPGNEESALKYLSFILGNEYWTRAWIVQEVILAQRAIRMVRNHLIPLSALITSLPSPRLPPNRVDDLSREIFNVLRAWRQAKKDRRYGEKKAKSDVLA